MTIDNTNPATEVEESRWPRKRFLLIFIPVIIILLWAALTGGGNPPTTHRIATKLGVTFVRPVKGAGGIEGIEVTLKTEGGKSLTPTGTISLNESTSDSQFTEPVCKVDWSPTYGPTGYLCPLSTGLRPGESATFTATYPGNKSFLPSSGSTSVTAPAPRKVIPPTTTTTAPTHVYSPQLIPTSINPVANVGWESNFISGSLVATLAARDVSKFAPTGYVVFSNAITKSVLCRTRAVFNKTLTCKLNVVKLSDGARGPGKSSGPMTISYPGDSHFAASQASGQFTISYPVTPPATTTTSEPTGTTTTTTQPVATTTTTQPVEPPTTSTVPAPIVPSAPLNVVATNAPGSTDATISWTAPTNDGFGGSAGSRIVSYEVTGTNGADCSTAGLPASTSCTVSGLTVGDSYTFTVYAINPVGSGPDSAPSNEITVTALATVPSAPLSVAAVASGTSVNVSWSPPASDGGDPILSYFVTDGSGNTCTYVVSQPETDMCEVTGLTNGNSYSFEVAATNAVGQGPFSVDPEVQIPALSGSSMMNTSLIQNPYSMQESGGYLWISNRTGGPSGTGSVIKVNVSTGAAVEVNSADFNYTYLGAIDGTDVWGNSESGTGVNSIFAINEASSVVTTISNADFVNPVPFYSNGTDVWIQNSNASVDVYDIATGVVSPLAPPTGYPYLNGLTGGDGNVFFLSYGSSSSTVIDLNIATGVFTEIPVPLSNNTQTSLSGGSISDASFDGTDIWIPVVFGSGATDYIMEVNVTTNAVSEITNPSFGAFSLVYSNGTDAWVTGENVLGPGSTTPLNPGFVSEIDIATGAVSSVSSTVIQPFAIVGSGSNVFIADAGSDSVFELTP